MIQHTILPPPPTFLGEEIRLTALGELDPSEAATGSVQPASGSGVILVYGTEAGGCVYTGGRTYALSEDTILAIWVTGPVSARSAGGVLALLEGTLCERHLAPLWSGYDMLPLPRAVCGALERELRTAWNTIQLGAAVDGYWCCARAFELLTQLRSAWEQRHVAGPSPLVEQAVTLIQQEFAYLEGIEDLADRLGVSKCHLIRRFRTEMGIPPGKYLVQTRVSYAKLLLQSGQYRLETIADLVGIAGSNYFCKVFRRETGLTPEAYARSAPHLPPTEQEKRLDHRLYL